MGGSVCFITGERGEVWKEKCVCPCDAHIHARAFLCLCVCVCVCVCVFTPALLSAAGMFFLFLKVSTDQRGERRCCERDRA